MKKILLILLFNMPIIMIAQVQSFTISDGTPTYSDVILTSLSKSEQYNNAKIWVSNTFSSSKAVIDLDDKENGKLIVKCLLTSSMADFWSSAETNIDVALQLDFREGKYRYISKVIDYKHSNTSQQIPELIDIAEGRKKSWTNTKKYAQKQLDEIHELMTVLISDLQNGMQQADDF